MEDSLPSDMAKREALTEDQIKKALAELPDWSFSDRKLHAEFSFKNFNSCFSVMTSVALLAEKLDHHPEWSNVYNKLSVSLTSHFADGVTELDIKMAKFLSELSKNSN